MKICRKITCILTSIALVATMSGIPAYAADTASSGNAEQAQYATGIIDTQGSDSSSSVTQDGSYATEAGNVQAPTESTGPTVDLNARTLRITVMQGILPVDAATFTITATNPDTGQSATAQVAADQFDGTYRRAETSFRDFEDGSYIVTIAADGFAQYKQTVELDGYDGGITVYTDRVMIENAQPGIIAYGDLNGDGLINAADATLLIDGIFNEVDPADDPLLNLKDNEGEDDIDIVDLQTLAEGMNQVDASGNPVNISAVKKMVPSAAVAIAADEDTNTQLEGDPTDLLNSASDTTVGLANANGAEITPANPVSLTFDFSQAPTAAAAVDGMVIEPPQNTSNAIADGVINVETEDGSFIEVPIVQSGQDAQSTQSTQSTQATQNSQTAQTTQTAQSSQGENSILSTLGFVQQAFAAQSDDNVARIDPDGTIVVRFSGKIAIKKVTIKVTKTSNSTNLAEITSVEFLNNMESHIAPPEMNIPTSLQAEAGSNQFTLTWSKEPNVTGYEVSVKANGTEEFVRTTQNSVTVTQFEGKKMKNLVTYTVKVQSMNGDWRSGWSQTVEVTPAPNRKPPAPDMVKITGGFRSLSVSWKSMDDTDFYRLYYREKTEASEAEAPYTLAGDNIATNRFTVSNLKDSTTYQVYLVGVNTLGVGPSSIVSIGSTIAVDPISLPQYYLVNTQNEDGNFLNNISRATYGRGAIYDSPLDAGSTVARSALGWFDNDLKSYVKIADWDEGGCYPGSSKGFVVDFTSTQEITMISLAETSDLGAYGYVNVRYIGANGGSWQQASATIHQRTAANKRKYYIIKLATPINATRVWFGIGRASGYVNTVNVAEIRFHGDGGLESDILNLYTDNLFLQLRDDVTAQTINSLQERLDTPDPANGEYHPFRSTLQVELDAARKLLETGNLTDVTYVHNEISAARDSRNLGIGGLNAWQPLGVTAGSGDHVVIYVGAPGAVRGKNSSLQLVMTQQHPEASAVAKVIGTLKVGRNEVTLPQMNSFDAEQGGQLYVAYTGSNNNDRWATRVSCANHIPVLDLYQVTNPGDRYQKVRDYVAQLETYTSKMQSIHNDLHQNSDNQYLKYSYNAKNCIANATDVLLDQMMYSVPASQMLSAAGSGSTDDKATRLLNAFDSMDTMMELFYQHKGLGTKAVSGTATANLVPYQHLNIRYCRMFDGAFMYASGNHIGIEWGSVTGLGQQSPTISTDGTKESGSFFGWGIAHEIGHNINQSQYSYAEVTNNYFAMLATGKTRFTMANVYDRVTSSEVGRTRDVFTQLAMYWQLRAAYDVGNPYKLYSKYSDITSNYLFARIDSYARTPSSAPAPGGVALTLDGGEMQNIMRLASAATQRDLTDFFARWGIIPNATTTKYVSQFAPETRALYYGSDETRAYSQANSDDYLINGQNVVSASASMNGSMVTLTMQPTANTGESLLGYEVTRITHSFGTEQREVVGFTTTDTFTDDCSHLGNRGVSYEVCAVNKFLNRSNSTSIEPMKLQGDGYISKAGWSVTTNMTSTDDMAFEGSEDDPDACEPASATGRMIDSDYTTVYSGKVNGANAVITLDMGKVQPFTSLRYSLPAGGGTPMSKYAISVSTDGKTYTDIGTGTFNYDGNGQAMVYFSNGEDPWICTNDARYIRIEAPAQNSIAVGELDVYGPSGDNIDFMSTESGEPAVGILAQDYVYQQASDDLQEKSIPAGSIVFTGTFKGNPAYNVVILYDDAGNIVGGVDEEGVLMAHQIILAPDPKNAMLGETADGRWVYWIETGDVNLPAEIYGELFRVDNALTNEGQRLVSDSLAIYVPSAYQLPALYLTDVD